VAEERRENLREMNLLDHLEELRSTLIASAIAWLIASGIIWFFSAQVLDFLIRSLPVQKLYFYSPAEAFMIRMKLSFILGVLVSFPYLFFRIWRFVSPGLFKNEKGLAFPLSICSVVLFYVGLVFAYWAMMPIVLRFFVKFGTDRLSPLLSVDRYFGFVAKLCFAFGLVFQMPLVVIVLTWMRVVSARALLGQWRWVIIVIFSISAVLTPPDVVSQIFMAVPLCVLFFASAVASLIIEKRRARGEGNGA
jgi:sec-independent protein translocase protein TatC